MRPACRLMAPNGRADLSNKCLMLGGKQTSKIGAVTSAYDPHRTFLWKSDCQLIASTTADMG
jgi:hypothetical protein